MTDKYNIVTGEPEWNSCATDEICDKCKAGKTTEAPTEEATVETWEINRCRPEYIQMYSLSNKKNQSNIYSFNHITIYFNRLKYSSEYGGELILYLNDLVIARVGMEDKTVVLGEGVDLLELLNSVGQE